MTGCGCTFKVRASYLSHLTAIHQLDLAAHGTRGEVFGQYACRLCGASIAHKYNNIASHVTLIHDLTLSEYEAKFHPPEAASNQTPDRRQNEEEEDEEEDHYVIDEEEHGGPEEGEVDEHYEFTEDDIIIEHSVEDGEDGEEEEEVEVAQASTEVKGRRLGREEEEVTEVVAEGGLGTGGEHAWYHGSNLTCKICYKTFANDQWYFHHFSKIHGITKEQYNEKYGKEGEIYHQYQCLICNSEIRYYYILT